LFTLISVDSHAGYQTLYITSTNTSYHIDQHIDRHLSQSLMVSEAIALVGTDQDGRRYGGKLTRKGSQCGRDSAQWLAGLGRARIDVGQRLSVGVPNDESASDIFDFPLPTGSIRHLRRMERMTTRPLLLRSLPN
jgi:hypothetical protein